jgi:diaminohydroxyphosphoribosylaminopyrimidine deaminase/5-amino-6-(5-phosphoribosylamino)uracil reductase
MTLRRRADAILVGVNTVLADDPKLTLRPPIRGKKLLRVVLDSDGRIPLTAGVLDDPEVASTVIVATRIAKAKRSEIERRGGQVWLAPGQDKRIDLKWLMRELGRRQITHLLVEGGGEVHASFLSARMVHRVYFFYAPLLLGDRLARKAIAGRGAETASEIQELCEVEWRRIGVDWMLTGRMDQKRARSPLHK